MKRFFHRRLTEPPSLAILDINGSPGSPLVITRINVPASHRGKGIGSELLRECLEEADRTGTDLLLEYQASGPLTNSDLKNRYSRNGFTVIEGRTMKRPPNTSEIK